MKGIAIIEKGKTEITSMEKPVCNHDTMLLETLYSGLSNGTEKNKLIGGNYSGKYPHIFGYQNVSRVIDCGKDITGFKPGDIIYTGFDSGHVEYYLSKETDLIIKLPENVDLKEAALFGVASVPFHDARLASVTAEDNCIVFGAGLIGQFAAQAARSMGARVTIVDPHDNRLQIAKELGADVVANIRTEEGRKLVEQNKPYSVVFECCGAHDVLDYIIGKDWGEGIVSDFARILLIAGRFDVKYNFNAASSHQISLISTVHFTQKDLDNVTRLVSKGTIRITPLISHVVPVDQAVEIYNTLRDQSSKLLGVVFDWGKE